jgi:hypothetical protein
MVKRVDCTGIDPAKVSVRLLGMPPFSTSAIGSVGTLTFSCPGGTISGQAILETYEVESSVGDLLKGSASFIFTGS